MFSKTRGLRPRCYATMGQVAARSSQRVPPPRELPKIKSRAPLYLGVAAFACVAWASFLEYALNYERACSSVVRTLLFKLKTSDTLKQQLGDSIHPLPFLTILGPEPYIRGSLNLLQGSVDVSFRIQGTKQSGTVYFTSIRPTKEAKFEIIRWKVVCQDGTSVDLINTESPTL